MPKQKIKIIFSLIIFLTIPFFVGATTFSDNFDSYTDEQSVESAGWGLDYTTLELNGCRSGKCLKADITATGTRWYIMHALNESAPYIRFYAKRVGFDGGGGNKFLKLFGENIDYVNYANITFGQEYTNGIFNMVNTGDGEGAQNDTTCNWYWSSHSLTCPGTANLTTSNLDMEDNRWYAFEVHVYPNTNGNFDGLIQVWVDGIKRLEYSDLRMRHDSNIRNFTDLSFVNYVGGTLLGEYEMWFDDVAVGNSYIGLIDSGDTTPPNAPQNLIVI